MTRAIIDIKKKQWPATNQESGQVVIRDLKFAVENHQFVCLVGPSGCGKSTLLNLLAGLDKAFQGSLKIESDTGLSQPTIGYVFQNPRLLPWRTVRENIELSIPKQLLQTRHKLIDQLIDIMGLKGAEDVYPERLSLGMSRRVALVRAFAIEPDFLLMDEPFVSLDAPTARRVRQLLIDVWKERPHTVLFVTHDMEEAVQLADRILFLSKSPMQVISDKTVEIPRGERDEKRIKEFREQLLANDPKIRELL